MTKLLKRCISALICLSFLITFSTNVFGQTEEFPTEVPVELPNPPMQNIFFNVLWGSITGGMIMMSWSIIDDNVPKSERQSFSSMRNKFVEGATYGGVLGLFAGVYLSMNNIIFDEGKTRITFLKPLHADFNNSSASAYLTPDQFNLMNLEIHF
ncbi:MAG: hypothetical protein HOD92_23735 [Deltaproteobacteria bacterium]|jgi:MFS family permease|nr:hypothetical protein [Deltaproteobacteria bacterium]MBT4527534.1 hypothetical protein [Deltaproteobacteria bacterium]